ncbi:MAG: M3 family metallopeptidase [Tannerella sp.]|jgi:peptidyl-dipeptidase Dcp|nr:M3 family metallopeptidase [Tannerella sp.]
MKKKNNPFFDKYTTEYQAVPFDKIKNEHYIPAFDEGFRLLREEVDQIAENPRKPSFENTIVELERSGELLKRVSNAFFGVFSAVTDDERMEIAQTISPKMSECQHYVYLNKPLFKRVREVYLKRDSLNLSVEDIRLLENTYKGFIDSGAGLKEKDRKRYKELSTELSLLSLDFDNHVLKDENSFELFLTDKKDLRGLPANICHVASLAAKEKGRKGWLFTLSAPSYVPFMRYADNRGLREKMYMAKMTVGCSDNEFDNRGIVEKIVNKRLEVASLLGFDNYASYVLKDKMAKNQQQVYKLLCQLLKNYKPLAENEYKTLQEFASGQEEDNTFVLMPWDWSYYAEKLKKQLFKVDDEMTRPYFELERVRNGIFGLASDLYGLTFRKNLKIPVYHEDVTVYEVTDSDKTLLGILYTDFFSRETKQSGAWMSDVKGQFVDERNIDHRPHVMISMNFQRPTKEHPSLLTYSEVKTFLHEFGHALHGLLSQCRYESMSGTNVKHDFVELPSQIMENWLDEKEFLDCVGVHYKTGKKMPAKLIKNIIDSSNFNVGYACCRQVSFGLLDMAWHTLDVPFSGNMERFEKKAWRKAFILPEVKGTIMSCSFGHLFSGGYAAGYYGYKWAEVLDADAFSLFKEKGIFDKETAQSFRNNILSRGDSEDPNELYVRFRGRKPTIKALLQRNGILSP